MCNTICAFIIIIMLLLRMHYNGYNSIDNLPIILKRWTFAISIFRRKFSDNSKKLTPFLSPSECTVPIPALKMKNYNSYSIYDCVSSLLFIILQFEYQLMTAMGFRLYLICSMDLKQHFHSQTLLYYSSS